MFKYITVFPHVLRYATTSQNPPLTFALNEPGTTTLDLWKAKRLSTISDGDPIKFGFFAVNMKYDHRLLIEEFAKWLRRFEGKPMLEVPREPKGKANPKPPGRKSIRDALNGLGIMRLRYYCDTFKDAQERMQALKRKSHGMFYASRHSASRACTLALRQFRNLLSWLDPGKPIHFTASWRGAQK